MRSYDERVLEIPRETAERAEVGSKERDAAEAIEALSKEENTGNDLFVLFARFENGRERNTA